MGGGNVIAEFALRAVGAEGGVGWGGLGGLGRALARLLCGGGCEKGRDGGGRGFRRALVGCLEDVFGAVGIDVGVDVLLADWVAAYWAIHHS